MQVRMETFTITDEDRRAIRFSKDKRKTMCSRDEAKEWISGVVQAAIADLRYRWDGGAGTSAAVANGADAKAYEQFVNGNGAPAANSTNGAPVSVSEDVSPETASA